MAKNQNNLQQRLEEIGQNEHIWLKMVKFWSKYGQKSVLRIFPPKKFASFFKRPKNMFLWQKIRTIYSSVWKKQAKMSIFGSKTVILTHFSKSAHRILLIFLIETTFVVYYQNCPVKLSSVCFAHFWTIFHQKIVVFDKKSL